MDFEFEFGIGDLVYNSPMIIAANRDEPTKAVFDFIEYEFNAIASKGRRDRNDIKISIEDLFCAVGFSAHFINSCSPSIRNHGWLKVEDFNAVVSCTNFKPGRIELKFYACAEL